MGNEWYCNQCQEHKQAYKIMNFSYHYLPKILILTLKRFEYRDISSIVGMNNSLIHREKIETFIDFPINGLDLREYCGLLSQEVEEGEEVGEEGEERKRGKQKKKKGRKGSFTGRRKRLSSKDMTSTEADEEGFMDSKEGDEEGTGGGEEGMMHEEDDDEGNDAIYDLFAICNHYGRMGFGHYTAFVRDWPLYEEATGVPLPPTVQRQIDAHTPTHTMPRLSDKTWYSYDDQSVVKVTEKDIKTSSAYILFYRKRYL